MNVMIDLETLGTDPGCVIVSFAAVKFMLPPLGDIARGTAFYRNIKADSCEEKGLTINKDTFDWWMHPDRDEARAKLVTPEPVALDTALISFAVWLGGFQHKMWSHGASFDLPILTAAYKACTLKTPWDYHNIRDTRTKYEDAAMFGFNLSGAPATKHYALTDAIWQAEQVMEAHQAMLKGAVDG